MRAAPRRVVPGLLAALCAASLAWAAEPTSPQTKAEMIRLIDMLEKQPNHPDGREMRGKVLAWLTEAPDVSVSICGDYLGIQDLDKDQGGALVLQQPFAEAKFILEHPDKANDEAAVHLAGIESALRAYAALKAEDSKLVNAPMEALVKLQADQKLPEHVSKAMAKCNARK